MKKIALFLFLFINLCSLHAEEECSCYESDVCKSFRYFNVGLGPAPLPIPTFGVGYREQWNQNGYDLSTYVSTIYFVTQIKASALYLHYFNPDYSSQMYVGGGLGLSGYFGSSHSRHKNAFSISPEFVLGKEYLNESGDQRFIQMQVSFPTCSNHHVIYYPLVVFSYGMGF